MPLQFWLKEQLIEEHTSGGKELNSEGCVGCKKKGEQKIGKHWLKNKFGGIKTQY